MAWWHGKQFFISDSGAGLPSLSNCAYPQPPVAAYFFESLTMNWRYHSGGSPATNDWSRPKTLLFSSDGTYFQAMRAMMAPSGNGSLPSRYALMAMSLPRMARMSLRLPASWGTEASFQSRYPAGIWVT